MENEKNTKLELVLQIRKLIHDITTPLSTIRLIAESLRDVWPTLLEAYQKAQEANLSLEKSPISPKQITGLERALNGITEEINVIVKLNREFTRKLQDMQS